MRQAKFRVGGKYIVTSVQINVVFRSMLQPLVIEILSFPKTLQIFMRLKGTKRLLWKKTFCLIETFAGFVHETLFKLSSLTAP